MSVYRLGAKVPAVAPSAFVADDARVVGDVTLGERASVWFGAVARGDNGHIAVGDDSNVQDGAILHSSPGHVLRIGRGVTVGHQAMLHGCDIGDGSLIGIQAVVLDGAKVGARSLLGAGAIVTAGMVVPEESLVLGAPARVVRPLRPDELARLADNAARYVRDAACYRAEMVEVPVERPPASPPADLPVRLPLRVRIGRAWAGLLRAVGGSRTSVAETAARTLARTQAARAEAFEVASLRASLQALVRQVESAAPLPHAAPRAVSPGEPVARAPAVVVVLPQEPQTLH